MSSATRGRCRSCGWAWLWRCAVATRSSAQWRGWDVLGPALVHGWPHESGKRIRSPNGGRGCCATKGCWREPASWVPLFSQSRILLHKCVSMWLCGAGATDRPQHPSFVRPMPAKLQGAPPFSDFETVCPTPYGPLYLGGWDFVFLLARFSQRRPLSPFSSTTLASITCSGNDRCSGSSAPSVIRIFAVRARAGDGRTVVLWRGIAQQSDRSGRERAPVACSSAADAVFKYV